MVALFGAKGKFFCGASVINSQYLLTAAHCLYGKKISDVQVAYGSLSMDKLKQRRQPIAWFSYPDVYRKEILGASDIAIIKLRRPVSSATGAKFITFSTRLTSLETASFPSVFRAMTIRIWCSTTCV